jgi:aryl-alcohol dehydrogenase-like predicted oxidoreductase
LQERRYGLEIMGPANLISGGCMKTRNIPGTDMMPSVICLGTSHFGDTVSRETSFAIMDRFLDLGGSFLDTAKVYGDWVPSERSLSEKVIGEWMKKERNRSRIVLATKGAHPELSSMHIPRLSKKDIEHDLEQSLKNLQTDYIDLYWLHRDDPQKSVEYVIDMMNEWVRLGKIRYFGCSNWRSERIEAAQKYAESKGVQGFAASQTRWSLATYPPANDPDMVTMDEKERAYHVRTGLTAVPYNSQASGLFSGRYSSEILSEPRPENRKVWKLCSKENLRKLRYIETIARQLNLTMTQVSLGYFLSNPEFPVFPICGVKNLEQLEDSCAAGIIQIDRQLFVEIDGI